MSVVSVCGGYVCVPGLAVCMCVNLSEAEYQFVVVCQGWLYV